MTLGCSEAEMQPTTLDTVAEEFVKLALAVGQHDADYVDAYFGPEEWRAKAEEESLDLDEILDRALTLSQSIDSLAVETADSMLSQRQRRLAASE